MFASGPQSLYFFRVLVGITEAVFLPGMLLHLTYWFPLRLPGRANAWFMIAMLVTAAVGSVIFGAILIQHGLWALP